MTATTITTMPRAAAPAPARAVIPTPQRDRLGSAIRDDARPGARGDGWSELIASVREAGQYPTTAEAERVTRIVLSALGGQVTGEERVDLARALPTEAAAVIASQIPLTRPQPAPEFVDTIAARIEGSTPATARWDVSSVLSVLPDLAGEDLIDRIIAQLPPGYALLFGRAELTPAVPSPRS
ncbi:DUF2267 domain-containing protein [Streptomyces sp. NPDC058914]|uniref:DUF2267 domain-containing protein n=1 Tax=Streptomyces sp. NPDC058914 TaxID=3346671 RepID=UPI003689A5BD